VSGLGYSHGRLSYRRTEAGTEARTETAEERGREDWALTRNRDGSRTLRCLAMTDDSEFVRDASYTLDPQGRVREVFVRLMVEQRWVGSGYFRVEGDRLEVVVDMSETGGRSQESLRIPKRFHVMTHAVMLDGWTFWPYDEDAGGEQELTVYNTSTRWNGTDGPLGRLETIRVTALGSREIQVPAGRFPCRGFRVTSDVIPNSPPSEIWVTGEDDLLVRYDWGGLGLEYVLSELRVEG